MKESKKQLNEFLTQVSPSLYFGGKSRTDETELLKNKIKYLSIQLDNNSPISPYDGKTK